MYLNTTILILVQTLQNKNNNNTYSYLSKCKYTMFYKQNILKYQQLLYSDNIPHKYIGDHIV